MYKGQQNNKRRLLPELESDGDSSVESREAKRQRLQEINQVRINRHMESLTEKERKLYTTWYSSNKQCGQPFSLAVEKNDLELFESLFKERELHEKPAYGYDDPFTKKIIEKDSIEFAELAHRYDNEVFFGEWDRHKTDFFYAARKGSVKVLAFMLNHKLTKREINGISSLKYTKKGFEDGRYGRDTAMHKACEYYDGSSERRAVLEMFLAEKSANFAIQDVGKFTPLMTFYKKLSGRVVYHTKAYLKNTEDAIEITKIFLERADVRRSIHFREDWGHHALSMACSEEIYPQLLETVLSYHDIDVLSLTRYHGTNAESSMETNILHLAVSRGDAKAVKQILKHPSVQGKLGQLLEANNPDILSYCGSVEVALIVILSWAEIGMVQYSSDNLDSLHAKNYLYCYIALVKAFPKKHAGKLEDMMQNLADFLSENQDPCCLTESEKSSLFLLVSNTKEEILDSIIRENARNDQADKISKMIIGKIRARNSELIQHNENSLCTIIADAIKNFVVVFKDNAVMRQYFVDQMVDALLLENNGHYLQLKRTVKKTVQEKQGFFANFSQKKLENRKLVHRLTGG